MNISEIIAAYKAYYKKGGQGINDIHRIIFRQLVSEELFTIKVTDETVWQASKVEFGRIVQAYQKGFTPINPLAFKPLEIKMFHQKMDTSETPHDLEATWLGFLAGDEVSPKDWPFVRWWIEKNIVPQIKEDIEVYEIGTGVRVEPTTGVAGAAGASMDGFLTIQNQLTTAGKITPIAMGALPTDDIDLVDYVEDFADQIDKKYWNQAMTIATSETVERRYLRGKSEKYGNKTRGNSTIDGKVEFTNLTLKGYPSMASSNRLWCSPKDNCVSLRKKTVNEEVFDIQPFNREVKLLSDWYRGVGYILGELVFRTDQA